MSRASIDTVRRIYLAWNRADEAAARELLHPEIEVEYHGVMIDKETSYRGHAGVRELTRSTLEDFEDYRLEVEKYIDHGDQVIAFLRQHAVGKQSGAPVEFRNAHVWTVRDGKAVRWRICRSKAQAPGSRRTPGISEPRTRDSMRSTTDRLPG
jgi:ketosteroid isomerase-like protein